MSVDKISAATFAHIFLAGAKNLDKRKDFINELNVFPVPDGDTGTNMTMTIMSAVKEVSGISKPDMKTLSKAISSGSLRGARGNSGVILSQLLRGFTKAVMDYEEIDAEIFAEGCTRAVDTAYKAVMRPKEGTILTVARGIADKAVELAPEAQSMAEYFRTILEHGEKVLSMTPEMLPVLKEAGVVDSGGQGLMEFLWGAFYCYIGQSDSTDDFNFASDVQIAAASPAMTQIPEEEIKFGYCTEFIIKLEKEFNESDEREFKTFLSDIGDSIVCVADDDIVKIHVHTNDPGLAIQKALTYGQLSRMKIDNMREEHEERLFKEQMKAAGEHADQAYQTILEEQVGPRKDYGFITVSIGEGFSELFHELGCDMIIEGGQTMNPSTEDILDAVTKINADHIFIFPNNKNIILAANQARDLVEDKDIIVVPTTTIPQGITAMLCYDPDNDVETNQEMMLDGIKTVHTGQVTYAVRNTKIDERKIKKGDFMGIGDEGILANGTNLMEVTMEMTGELAKECSIITVYYGTDIDEESAEKLGSLLEDAFPGCEINVNPGGQPIYYFIIAAE